MTEEIKKNSDIMDGQGETDDDDFEHDPEKGGNVKYRLPFALCKENGIPIQDWWTPRDAWEALENHGYVDDVDEEYAEMRRQEKRDADKKWREEHPERVVAWRERAKTKKAQLKDPNHNPDKNYVHVDGKIAGVAKSKPMTHEQADSGKVNPYYGSKYIGYQTNCQTCVAVYAARLQGYDVRALPNLNNKYIYQLSHNPALAFIDEKGQHPKFTHLARTASQWGLQPGHQYGVRFWSPVSKNGHIVTATLGKDGQVHLYDPQNNSTAVGDKAIRKYINDIGARATNYTYAMDITNYRMDEEYCDKIMIKESSKNGKKSK